MISTTKTSAVSLSDFPVAYAHYARRTTCNGCSEQDILYAFSKNNNDNDKKIYNDVIGLSNLYVPAKGKRLSGLMSNFYNCVDSHRLSQFSNNKALIVG